MKVCVIGAGPSGLTTIKQLRDEGHDVTCFEKDDGIGGIWYRHDADQDQVKAYDSLILTISMKLMCFSDFMVEGERRFATHQGYLQYLIAYADKYGLCQYIRFSSMVTQLRKVGNEEWRITVVSSGSVTEHVFEAVAVCSGPFRTPELNIPGRERFAGQVLHSSCYRDNRAFSGKRVLVVGLAESGADILREISEVASECTLSLRSRSFLVPRLFNGKYSTDMFTLRAHHYEMWVRSTKIPFRLKAIFGEGFFSRAVFLGAARLYGAMTLASNMLSGLFGNQAGRPKPGELNNLGQPLYPLKADLFTEDTQENLDLINEWNRKSHKYEGNYSQRVIFCKNVSFVPNIRNGKIKIRDAEIIDIQGSRVHFKDGTTQEADALVLCTGFKNDFTLLGDIRIKDNNVRTLYKHSIHPEHGGRLALMGFVRPFSGGIPLCAEMQARYFALLCSNKLRLPADLHRAIEAEKSWEESWTALSPRHFEAVPSQIFFLDALAKEIGCLPELAELLRQPELLTRLWFYAFNQSCYRLRGAHNLHDSALQELMKEELPGRYNPVILLFSLLSLLPYFVHPKDQNIPPFRN